MIINLRKIKYDGIETFAPSIEDTHRLLETEYGKKYIKPLKTFYLFGFALH